MLRLMIAALLFTAAPAQALETDCPLTDPENPSHRLVGAHPRYGGEDRGESAAETRRGDYWRDVEQAEKYQSRDGELVCHYRGPNGGGRDTVLKISGLLARCDWLGRDALKPRPVEPDTGGPIERIYIRVWCTSRP